MPLNLWCFWSSCLSLCLCEAPRLCAEEAGGDLSPKEEERSAEGVGQTGRDLRCCTGRKSGKAHYYI